ncbi:MAG: fatty acid desaturase family protein [Bacteriovoracaceae bacterium]
MENLYKKIDITIPSNLNLIVAIASMSFCAFFLWLASHSQSWILMGVSMIGFGFVGNTVFSLLHEAVHSNFHHKRSVNYFFGNLFSSFFPTGFSFQRRCHLNHHKNNRTDFELFETYHEGDNKILRSFVLYSVLSGLYWLSPLVGSLWLLIHPSSLIGSGFTGKNNFKLGRMGGASMLRNFENITKGTITRMRLEIVFMFLFQASLFYILDLSFKGWILCYGSFAVLWSSLQYTDHAYSVRDIRHGAWNLKVNPITKAFFLNYHDHLAHHENPHVSWIHLPKFVDHSKPRPSFWSIYLRMWKGIEKIERSAAPVLDPELEKLIEQENFKA